MTQSAVFAQARPISSSDRLALSQQIAFFKDSIDGRTLLLTGGTGFFGKWLTQTLNLLTDDFGSRHKVVIWTRSKSEAIRSSPWLRNRTEIEWYEGDIRAPLAEAIHFDSVLHAATPASAALNEGHPREMFDVILEGTKNVLLEARKRKVMDLLFVSSGGVYGQQPSELSHLPETFTGAYSSFSPSSAYGLGKTSAEFLCSCYSRDIGARVTIARCFAFVGPYLPLDTHFAVGNFIQNVLERKPIYIRGDGTPVRSYLYGSDLVIWLLKIFAEGKSLQPYHVGSERAVSIQELAEIVSHVGAQSVGHRSEIQIGRHSGTGQVTSRFVPSTKFTREMLSLEEKINLEQAIAKTFDWHIGKI